MTRMSRQRWRKRAKCCRCCARGTCAGSARRPAVPITARTFSVRRCSHRVTDTSRRRTRCAVSARQIDATARLKASFPDMVFVGSGYTYLQEWLPHVAQFNVRTGRTDFVGLGRAVLSYPRLAADVLSGATLSASPSAGHSATARRAPAWASCQAVIRSIPSTARIRTPSR